MENGWKQPGSDDLPWFTYKKLGSIHRYFESARFPEPSRAQKKLIFQGDDRDDRDVPVKMFHGHQGRRKM